MLSSIIESDPITKRTLIVHESLDSDEFHVESRQELGGMISEIKGVANTIDERARWSEMEHVAAIPIQVVEDLMRKGIWDDDKALLRWLDDRDNNVFRTRPGRLSR